MPALPFSKSRQAGYGALALCSLWVPLHPTWARHAADPWKRVHGPAQACPELWHRGWTCADAQYLQKRRRTWILRKIHHFHLSLHRHLYKDMDSFWNRLFWLMAEFQGVISDLNLFWWWERYWKQQKEYCKIAFQWYCWDGCIHWECTPSWVWTSAPVHTYSHSPLTTPLQGHNFPKVE